MDLGKLPSRPAFEKLSRRWVAERIFAWISHNRRMAKDYERLCSTGEAFIQASMTRLIARRLAHAREFSGSLSTHSGEQRQFCNLVLTDLGSNPPSIACRVFHPSAAVGIAFPLLGLIDGETTGFEGPPV